MQRYLTASEVVEIYGFAAKSTVYALAAAGKLPHIRLGPRHVRFPQDKLEEFLQAQVSGGASAGA